MTASGWTLVEPCCGTAALSLHLLGATRQLVPRQGSKWAFRRILEERIASVALGRPGRRPPAPGPGYEDPGGRVWQDPEKVLELLKTFRGWTVPGARRFWRRERERRNECCYSAVPRYGGDDPPTYRSPPMPSNEHVCQVRS